MGRTRTLLTANRNILAHTYSFVIGNEDEDAWNKLNAATKTSSPTFDEPRTFDFSDADKGAAASFANNFENTTQVLDLLHRENTVQKTTASNGGGADGKSWYMRAFYAPTPAKLEAIKQAMPPKTAQLLGQHSYVDQYPVASGGTIDGCTALSRTRSIAVCAQRDTHRPRVKQLASHCCDIGSSH